MRNVNELDSCECFVSSVKKISRLAFTCHVCNLTAVCTSGSAD